eukprot:CFRG1403T1
MTDAVEIEKAKVLANTDGTTIPPATTKGPSAQEPKTLTLEEQEEKRKARAARFGIPMVDKKVERPKNGKKQEAAKPATEKKDIVAKNSGKRQAPTPTPKALSMEDVERIKKRAERFGTTDSEQYAHALLEEKRLKRAMRFSSGGDATASQNDPADHGDAIKKAKVSEGDGVPGAATEASA